MITGRQRGFLAILLICLCSSASFAEWTTVGDGIEYQQFTLPDPNNVFVSRMLRSNVNASIESCFAQGHISGALEVMSSQAARFDDAINYWDGSWGKRNDVVVAINGDRFSWGTGVISGGQVHSGWYIDRYPNKDGRGAFGWKFDRSTFIGDCMNHTASRQIVTYIARQNTQMISGVNVARGADQLILYTPQYNSTTMTTSDSGSVEVIVEMTSPTIIQRSPSMARGFVRQIRQAQGSTPIPFDHIVLSATGTAATTLLANISIGAEIGISQDLTTYVGGCSTVDSTVNWQGTCASIQSIWTLLRNGVIVENTNPEILVRDPRTVIAYNDTYVFFVVCDGRSPVSAGMNGVELATFCKDMLGATWAVNLDGGGSTTMVVNGVVKNSPSEGQQRQVANGMMMINLLPKVQSSSFSANQIVKTTANANLRLGPGTNYDSISTISNNTQGIVLDHAIKGVQAKGYNWWKVDFNGTAGWVVESNLSAALVAPIVTVHPQPQVTCPSGSAAFTVSAVGPGTLTYQWRKNGTDLANGGHYSGVTTATLTIVSADAGDAASYSCSVANSYGSTASSAADLSINTIPASPVDGQPAASGTGSITWKWNDVSGETGYRVKDVGGIAKSGNLSAGSTQWIETTGITANTQYTRKIYAFNACGESAGSIGQSGYSSQNNPSLPTLGSIGTNSVTVTTTGPVNLSSGKSGVIFTRNNIPLDKVQSLTMEDTGCTPNTAYSYRAIGVNGDGVQSALSPPVVVYTLAKAGKDTDGSGANGNVWCANATENSWHGAGKIFTFINPLGFGEGVHGGSEWMAGAFGYTWNQNATEDWANGADDWYYGMLELAPDSGDGAYYLHIVPANSEYVYNMAGSLDYGPFFYDTAPPGTVAVTDEGQYTPSLTTLKATWTAGQDGAGSGVHHYEYAVGTSQTTQDIKTWTSVGNATSLTDNTLSLTEGICYYMHVRAVDNVGLVGPSAVSDGITVAHGVVSIGEALGLGDYEPFALRNKVVTAAIDGAFWLEETNQSAAVKVISSAGVALGNTVSVAGKLRPSGKQRAFFSDVVENFGGTASGPVALGMAQKYLGGSAFNLLTPGVSGGTGLYCVGKLVRCWGAVTYSDSTNQQDKFFYINDGSGLSDGLHQGIKVRCGSIEPPVIGFAAVTGVVDIEDVGGRAVPVIIIRDSWGITTF